MPASHGECVDGVALALCDTGRMVFDALKFDGPSAGSELSFASNCEIFFWSSLRPARTAASSPLTPPRDWALPGVEGALPETRRAILSAISRA